MSEELELSSNRAIVKVTSQLGLLVLIVFAWAYWMNNYHLPTDSTEEGKTATETTKLPIGTETANTYPTMKFKSDSKWDKYLQSPEQTISGRQIEGHGNISGNDVSVNCLLSENGQLIGRYRHVNGTTLDVNGYIDSQTDILHIRLGHGNEQSELVLSPDDQDPTDSKYDYSGTWGKRHKPASFSFSFK